MIIVPIIICKPYIQRIDVHDVVLLYTNGSFNCLGLLNCVITFISDGPKNLNIVEYGDHLKCSADANPIPIYRWTEDEANISINGSVYALTLINDKENTVYCAAGNIFASVSTNYTIKGCQFTVCLLYTMCDLFHNALFV